MENNICFKKLANDIVVEIENSLATAAVRLHGGRIVSWQPKSQSRPVFWASKSVKFQQGKDMRSGVPLAGHGWCTPKPSIYARAWLRSHRALRVDRGKQNG